jgi:hypothetical protein
MPKIIGISIIENFNPGNKCNHATEICSITVDEFRIRQTKIITPFRENNNILYILGDHQDPKIDKITDRTRWLFEIKNFVVNNQLPDSSSRFQVAVGKSTEALEERNDRRKFFYMELYLKNVLPKNPELCAISCAGSDPSHRRSS